MDEDCEPQECSLRELFETESLKWIFVGGKGGVGKTTTSCAIAAQLASRREKVLIISTDPAHNLSDAFTQKFTSSPTLVNGFSNLYAMELESKYTETAEYRLAGSSNLTESSSFQILPDILQAVPGIDEALSFAELMQSVQRLQYSTIVFDTAPTGHTLRLLSFPDLLERGLAKLSSYKDTIGAALGMVNAVSGKQIEADDITSKIDNLKAITTSIREAFQDAATTTFVCVCIPEFLSVYETERLVQELAKQKIDCSNIVVNQVVFPIGNKPEAKIYVPEFDSSPSEILPASVLLEKVSQGALESDSEYIKRQQSFISRLQTRLYALEVFHSGRRRMQSKYLQQISDLYSFDFHIVCMSQQKEEVRGVKRIQAFAQGLSEGSKLPLAEEQ